ncbi:MAG: tautomerase family protein [Thermoanaerobaculia bacterium]
MPLMHVHLTEGKSASEKRRICEAILAALVSAAKAPADSQFCWIHEHSRENLLVHPSFGGVERSEDPLLIEITLNQGRDAETKARLYAAIAANLERDCGVRPDDVIVSLREVPKENWSFGGGRATYREG